MKDNPGNDVLRFLHAVMYPHKAEFLDTVKEYIDFSQNQELWKEVDRMCGLGESILLEGESRGIKIGESRGIEIGESRGIKIGETNGVTRSAKVFKAIQAGETDNHVIAAICGCTVENVIKIREEFGI